MKTTQLKSLTIPTQVYKQIKVEGVEFKNKLNKKTHQKLIIKGPLGEQSLITPHFITVTLENNSFILNHTAHRSAPLGGAMGELSNSTPNYCHGQGGGEIVGGRSARNKKWTYQVVANLLLSQINQMVVGVTEGFKKQVKLVGIGYKIIATSESSITLNLGFSHPIEIEIPANINLTAEALKENKADQSQIEFKSTSLVDLNNFVYSIKRIRPINKSFKGTGVTII